MTAHDHARRLFLLPALAASLAACGGTPDAAPVPRRDEAPLLSGREADAHEAGVEPSVPVALTSTTAPREVEHVAARAVPARPGGAPVLRRAVVATDVVDHEPVGAGDDFDVASTGKLFVFLDLRSDDAGPTTVTVSFVRTDLADARERGDVTLDVPGAQRRYRTWAFSRGVRTPGAWAAIVRDADGRELVRLPFTVHAGAPAT